MKEDPRGEREEGERREKGREEREKRGKERKGKERKGKERKGKEGEKGKGGRKGRGGEGEVGIWKWNKKVGRESEWKKEMVTSFNAFAFSVHNKVKGE